MQTIQRCRRALIASILAAACNGGTGAPTVTTAPATVTPPASVMTAVPSGGANGVVSILSMLGGTHVAPASTSWIRVGITARWQAVVPSGLPAVTVSCRITGVELVN